MCRSISALSLACFLGSSLASAQTAPQPDNVPEVDRAASASETSAEANALIQQGIKLRREKRDDEALKRFEKAYSQEPSARARAQIGLAELALSRWLAADSHLRDALSSEGDWISVNRKTLEAALSTAADHLASLEVTSNVQGAELWINATRAGLLPLPAQRVLAGHVLVELRSHGGERVQRMLPLAGRDTLHLHIELRSDREATGNSVATKQRFRSSPLTTQKPALNSEESASNSRRTVAWVLVATGAVLLGEAVVAHVMRQSLTGEYNDDAHCFYGNLSREERCGRVLGKAETAQTLAIAGYIGAGLALGTAGVLFALPNRAAWGSNSGVLEVVYSGRF
jgi:hypothetical protein